MARYRNALRAIGAIGAGALAAAGLVIGPAAVAAEPEPVIDTVTVPGTHNSEMGCAADFQPDCTEAELTLRPDGIYVGTFDLPAGDYAYKVAINGSFDINYGAGGVPNGPNSSYTSPGGPVTFYFDPRTKFFQNTLQGDIAVAVGTFQSEVGCPADFQPDCLVSWLQDPDGDGIATWSALIPSGPYDAKVAVNLSFDVNYGAGGVANGPNVPFTAVGGAETIFRYDSASHELTVGDPKPQPVASKTTARADRLFATTQSRVRFSVSVVAADGTVPTGSVAILDRNKVIATAQLTTGDAGKTVVTLPRLKTGLHLLTARYLGSALVLPSYSRTSVLLIVR